MYRKKASVNDSKNRSKKSSLCRFNLAGWSINALIYIKNHRFFYAAGVMDLLRGKFNFNILNSGHKNLTRTLGASSKNKTSAITYLT